MPDTCVRWKVDIPQLLISTTAVFGIGVVCYIFNMKAFATSLDLMEAALLSKNHKWAMLYPPVDAEDSNIDADSPQIQN